MQASRAIVARHGPLSIDKVLLLLVNVVATLEIILTVFLFGFSMNLYNLYAFLYRSLYRLEQFLTIISECTL